MPDPVELTSYVRKTIALHPEKFGVMGTYALELMDGSVSRDMFYDMLAMRLCTSVLCGSTISQNPQVVLNQPRNAWQHTKHQIDWWQSDLDAHWQGYDRHEGGAYTPQPWLILLWPLLWLIRTWIGKRPVKYNEVKADIKFEQRILYPEAPAVPAHMGHSVIYETLDLNWPENHPLWGSRLDNPNSRFANRHEIASSIYRDPELNRYMSGPSASPDVVLAWLHRHGVNVDQLVQREAL
jgi:hypothetical protein